MTFLVEVGEYEYRIVGPNGEEGASAIYGQPAVLKIGNELYICDADENTADPKVERVTNSATEQTTCEEVDFEGEEVETALLDPDEEESEEEDAAAQVDE